MAVSDHEQRRDRERGSAVAEFAMVGALLVVVFLGAFQVGFALFVRNSLTAYAVEGARYGARADSTPEAGAERTRLLIRDALPKGYADDVTASETVQGGARVVTVRVRAQVPVLGPFGPSGSLQVSGRAYSEAQ
ncbi:TadE/TadG family type IV pilus assembly protein [Yimella sp. cx-51]|uniref:TadE/TadG family type IV pilus assembly protein n=1 Tax=Yimella sp. cx-51 TaxID=2770551 RepID=UPI001FCCAE1C|nr:TadE/TadG family type IV pilus assembly protein [Yimella sp. cx-51]